MDEMGDFPTDFEQCVRFHRHLCPGLAIGYAAVKAAVRALEIGAAEDEEVVAIVENDSCAVDAVQVLLGCTVGKGNLIIRDWGKQVYTFIDRTSGKAVRISFVGEIPDREERRALRKRIDSAEASDEDRGRLDFLKTKAVWSLISAEPSAFFDISGVEVDIPPATVPVQTRPCDMCGEQVVVSRLCEKGNRALCFACAAQETREA